MPRLQGQEASSRTLSAETLAATSMRPLGSMAKVRKDVAFWITQLKSAGTEPE